MSGGAIFRTCGCIGEDGRPLGARCPRRAASRHGGWGFVLRLPTTAGVRQMRRAGHDTRRSAESALRHVRALLDIAEDDLDRAAIGDVIVAAGRHLPDVDDVRRRHGRGQPLTDRTTVGAWLAGWLDDKRRATSSPAPCVPMSSTSATT